MITTPLSHSSSTTTERYTKVVDAHKIAPGEGLEDLFTKKIEDE